MTDDDFDSSSTFEETSKPTSETDIIEEDSSSNPTKEELYDMLKEYGKRREENGGYDDTPGSWLSEKIQEDKKVDIIAVLTEEVLSRYTFKTLDDTLEILWYDKDLGIWKPKGELKIYVELNKLGGYEVTINIRNQIIEQIKYRTLEGRENFNNDPLLVNCRNCIIDLRTMETFPHDPKFLFTQQIPHSYEPEKYRYRPPKEIFNFLFNAMHPSDVGLILEYIGYCLLHDCRFQKALMVAGAPNMGKSTFIDLITYFLGGIDNVASKSMQQLTEDKHAVADLFGKLANVFADLSNTRLKEIQTFKVLVTGDLISADHKFKTAFTFRPFVKLVFSANVPPLPPQGINDEDAYYRRWFIVSLNLRKTNLFTGAEIVKDPQLLEKLTTDEEMSGLLYLAVKAANRLLARRKFSKDPSIEEVTEEYLRKANPVKAWAEVNCVIGNSEYETEKGHVYADYEGYCRQRGLPVLTIEHLARNLNSLFQNKITDSRRGPRGKQTTHIWKGLGLRKDLEAVGLDMSAYFSGSGL